MVSILPLGRKCSGYSATNSYSGLTKPELENYSTRINIPAKGTLRRKIFTFKERRAAIPCVSVCACRISLSDLTI